MRKIVDCFTFFNELDMLEFRLTELYDVIDYFVIVEANYSHSGKKKELFFENNKSRYEKFLDKIIHIVVEDMPNTVNSWDNENHQRRCIDRGLQRIELHDDDYVIISDCDEIPDSKTLLNLKTFDKTLQEISILLMDLYYYNFTYKYRIPWKSAKILPWSIYKVKPDAEYIRQLKSRIIIKHGGWHLSYFGSIDFIKTKIKNFAHQEFNKDMFLDDKTIAENIVRGIDVYGRTDIKFMRINIEENSNLPKHYKMLIKE